MRRILSLLVENKPGVLARTAGLFARRGFNISSLAVGETDDTTVSRITLVADGDEWVVAQLEKQLNKQIDVIKVRGLDEQRSTRRELLLVKVTATALTRGELLDIANILGAKVVDASANTLILEHCDRPERIDLLLEMVSPYGIVELARTGMVALQKGAGAI